MGLYRDNGQRITRATFPAIALTDPPKRITESIWQTEPYGRGDGRPEGSRRHLLYQAGDVVPQSVIDRLFTTATITTITPSSGPAVGGTTITVTGTHLDGVSAVNFGAAAGTELKVVSATELRVKTPAGTAGAVNVVLVDDAGNVTKTGGFTYTA
jgi:hypothetical protein